MEIKEVKCKNCMTKSKLTDYVINPYVGCQHSCKYCYATFIKKFQNIKEDWGDFVYVKINCPKLLEKELEKNKPGNIWFSSVTDCYQPLEARYKLTKQILEIISKSPNKNKFSVEILTKSGLIKRDFDLLKRLNATVGCSINSLNSKTARILEPFASSPKERIEVLKEAKKSGIKVFGFISPVLPGITNLEEIFRELNFCEYVWVEILNIKSFVLQRLMPVVKKEFPEKVKDFEYMINHYSEYCRKIKKEVDELSRKYKLKVIDVVMH